MFKLCARWCGWSTPRPGPFIPGSVPVSIVQEAGWASGPVWTGNLAHKLYWVCITLLYSTILKLALSSLKLNTLQVLLPEYGGRLPKHVGGKTHAFTYMCTSFVFKYTIYYIMQYALLQLEFNPLKTKCRPLYLKTQSVTRCKHFSPRL
jgi:hypothetical protein